MKFIEWFDDVDADDVSLVGGKGANLGELTKAGIPVPAGFVVTADTYWRSVEELELRPRIEAALKGLDAADSASLERAAAAVKGIITDAEMPDDTKTAIVEAYKRMGEGPVAVRSSATAEDLAHASFAGQQSSFLNIEGAASVLQAVEDCWASLFEPRAIHYRQGNGFDHLEVGIAVVVQHMVQAERSGVMFTLEPVRSDATKIVVEAVYGLGEAIVSGEVTPDMYIVDKATLDVLEREVSEQDRKLVRRHGAGPGEETNEWVEVPVAERAVQKLTDEQVREMAEMGRRLEQHYGRPQDIEWAFEGGRFYIVQSRPVTTVAAG